MNCKITKMSTRTGMALVLMLCFLLSLPVAKAQSSVGPVQKDSVLTIIGELDPSKMSQTRTFTVPEGVTSVKIQCWGAGAAGAFMNAPGTGHDPRAGVGGGGGAYACKNSLNVTPGRTLTVVIGQGGYGSSDIHGNGGDTYVQYNGVTEVLAKGAEAVADDERSAVGKGGKKENCVGDVKHSGGNGGKGKKGNWAGSGAGGGVAGTGDDGHDGGNGIQPASCVGCSDEISYGGAPGAGYPFSSPNTGYGANGVVSHTGGTNGKNAVNFGGGGSGGASSKWGNGYGGDGGDGVVIISYEQCQANAGAIMVSTGCVVVINSQTAATGTAGVYSWEKSASGTGAWSVIAGATNKDLTPTDNGWYRRGYTTVCGNTIYTNTVQVTGLGDTKAPGFISIAETPAVTSMTACYEAPINVNLAANGTGATQLTWECSVGGGAWVPMATKSATETYTVSIPSIQQNTKYRYQFLQRTDCFDYSSNEFVITVDTGVIGRPDFYFDNDTVNIVMQYGDRDTLPYITTPIFYPSTGVSLSNNTPLGTMGVNEGYLLGRVDTGTYTIEWTVSDCGKTRSKKYNKVYIVSYPKCGKTYKALDADSNVYNTVRISAECWTRENLRTLHFNSGDTINDSRIYVSAQYNDTVANLATYGRLYTWYTAAAVTPHQVPVKNLFGHIEGVCPEGWVLPTEKQYRDLYVYDSRELRSTNLWLDGEGTNLTGMTMLPGGCYNAASGRCEDLLGYAYFWSDMETVGEKSFAFWVDCLCYQLQKTEYNKNNGMSIRCVKEKTPYAPKVLTKAVSDITSASATFNGVVIDGGALKVLDRGFCYGTTEMPSLENGTVVHAATAGTGAYSVPVSGLTEAGYYVRAYAVNAEGIAYGNQVSFGTVVHYTDTITFMPNGATGGTMPKQVVTRGVATTLSANQFTHGAPEAPDTNWAFIGWNTDALGRGTSYAAGANIITNGNDTLHAQWHTWCNGTARTGEMGTGRVDSVQDIDGNWYKVVQIGNQCWLKENLKTTRYANGDYISKGASSSTTTAYRYFPNNDTNNVAVYGHLYNWTAAMDSAKGSRRIPSGVRGVCPDGWHVPSDSEWTQLTNHVNQSAYQCNSANQRIAKALASTTGWKSKTTTCAVGNDQSLNNTTGFTGVPASYYEGIYSNVDSLAIFWSATGGGGQAAYRRLSVQSYKIDYAGYRLVGYGYSVRCVRDKEVAVNDTITFEPNGATGGTMPKQVVTRGVATTLSANQFTRGGNLSFIGWNTQPDGTGTKYADGATVTLTAPLKLYAQWGTFCTGTPRANEVGIGHIDSVKDHQNNWYSVVQIGTQCWLKENMRATSSPKTGLRLITSGGLYYNTESRSAGFYNNDSIHYHDRGVLYNYCAAVDTNKSGKSAVATSDNSDNKGWNLSFTGNRRGICPEGWHIPSQDEFATLANYTGTNGGSNVVRLATGDNWPNETSGTGPGRKSSTERNMYQFCAIPSGAFKNDAFSDLNANVSFWSSTVVYMSSSPKGKTNYYCPMIREISSGSSEFKNDDDQYNHAHQVRCVRN